MAPGNGEVFRSYETDLHEVVNDHFIDEHGNPKGGISTATGVVIRWQNGPLGKHSDKCTPTRCHRTCLRKSRNGAFVEEIIAIAKSRLEFYQTTKFKCDKNAEAISFLKQAISALNSRTVDRTKRGVEGTHTV